MTHSNTFVYITIAALLLVLTILELFIFGQFGLGGMRVAGLLTLMTVKALLVALFYMNLAREPLTLKISFFILIPVGLYFLLFMLYDAAYIWRS